MTLDLAKVWTKTSNVVEVGYPLQRCFCVLRYFADSFSFGCWAWYSLVFHWWLIRKAVFGIWLFPCLCFRHFPVLLRRMVCKDSQTKVTSSALILISFCAPCFSFSATHHDLSLNQEFLVACENGVRKQRCSQLSHVQLGVGFHIDCLAQLPTILVT